MPLHITGSAVPPEPIATGVVQQRLFPSRQAKDTTVAIDRFTVAAGASFRFDVAANSITWVQVLDGAGALLTPYTRGVLGESVSFTLPAGTQATLSTDEGLSFLQVEIQQPALALGAVGGAARLAAIDWRREPVFETKDARKRVLLVTPAIVNTAAFKADMVIYPPGGAAPMTHREGAETFVYVISGRGEATSAGRNIALRDGDLVHFPDRELHSLRAGGDAEFRFLQLNAPGTFQTVWAAPGKASTWADTGLDIEGRRPLAELKERWAYAWRGA